MSVTQTRQIKVTIPDQLYAYIKSKADKFGLTMSSYVKNMLINDVKDLDVPTFKMNEARERVVLDALDDIKKGKTRRIVDIDKYLDSL